MDYERQFHSGPMSLENIKSELAYLQKQIDKLDLKTSDIKHDKKYYMLKKNLTQTEEIEFKIVILIEQCSHMLQFPQFMDDISKPDTLYHILMICPQYRQTFIAGIFESIISTNRVSLMKMLLDNFITIIYQNNSIIRLCATSGTVEMMQLLIDYRVDITINNDEAVKIAIERRRYELIKILVDAGAQIYPTRFRF
jgi:hypothetical protein